MRPRPIAPDEWEVISNAHGLNFDARGIGLAEMAEAISENREPRASGQLGLHLCEVMQGMLDSPHLGRYIEIESSCDRPLILPDTDHIGLNVNLGIR